VFTKIRAAVTDIGGLTSHAAIVSREYGLPAVTGTGVATSVIKTGDIIKVDGSTGVVTIIRRA
jgi:pyruvate,water dikinase